MAVKESVSNPDDKNHFQKNNLSYLAKYIIANVNLSKCRSGIIMNSLPMLINLDQSDDSISNQRAIFVGGACPAHVGSSVRQRCNMNPDFYGL